MKKFLTLCTVALLGITLTACNVNQPKSNLPSDNGDNENSETSSTNDENNSQNSQKTEKSDQSENNSSNDLAMYADKLNPYINCINDESQRVGASYDRYLSWVDKDKGPTGNESIVYGLYTLPLDPNQYCLDALKKAKDLKPQIETLDKAGESYATALEKLHPLIEEASDYYEQEDYKDDAMAKGKEMHPKLMAAFDEFLAADKIVREEVDKLEDERNEKELALLKKQGPESAYLTKSLLIDAKNLVRQVEVADMKDIKVEPLTASIDSFGKALDALDAYQSKEKDTFTKSNLSLLVSEAKNYLKAAKDLMRHVRDNVEFSDSELMQMNMGFAPDGSPQKLIEAYNSLIKQANFSF